MFKTKLIVALTLAPPFVWLWYLGAPYFHALMLLFPLLAGNEVATMGAGKDARATRYSAMLCGLLMYLPVAFAQFTPWTFEQAVVVSVIGIMVVHMLAPGEMDTAANRAAVAFLGAFYGAVLIGYLLKVRDLPEHGRGLAFMALSLSWFTDTFAYFGGKAFGKTKLYEKMSPNKTVEGLLSGAVAAGIAGGIEVWAFGIPWPIWLAVLTGFVAAFWGQAGDLCESMLKRSFKVKDAGTFLPGHGGVLDRFDSVLFVAPLIWVVHHAALRWLGAP